MDFVEQLTRVNNAINDFVWVKIGLILLIVMGIINPMGNITLPPRTESVIADVKPVQDKFNEIMKDKSFIEKCAKEGAEKASYIANKTLSKVMKKVGFWQVR